MPDNGPEIHEAASGGYELQADAYQRARPMYHSSLAERVAGLASAGEPPNAENSESPSELLLIELGAGTGIFTRQLTANGCSVTAIEPVAAMRAALAEHDGPVTAIEGTAERMPIEDNAAAVVVASQSFHWFDYGPALDEIARVLAPGGHLVTVWNVRDNSVDWVSACTRIIDAHAGDTPRARTMRWRSAIDRDSRFETQDDFSVPNPWPTTPDGVVDRVLSTSFIAALDKATQVSVVAEIRRVVEPVGDFVDYPYVSELQSWRMVAS